VNTPDSILQISCLTPKDRKDLEFMLQIGVDWIALSFVQRPEDIVEITRLIMEHNPASAARPHVMAKIEKPSCFDGDSLHNIVRLCDGIMVARGDLGVECAPEDVPILQKTIIDECRLQGKPVVVATQMLESMIDNPTPTRAEASDVATAIYDGADAIMLSAESAAGMVRVSFMYRGRSTALFLTSHIRIFIHAVPRRVRFDATKNHQPCRRRPTLPAILAIV
jgi:pyruvate kinase